MANTRFSFAIMGQSTSELITGLAIEVKDTGGTVKASTSPSAGQLMVTDNNDGTYFVDGLSTGKYDVFTNGVAQNELKNVPFVSNTGLAKIDSAVTTSDIVTSATNDDTKVWGGALLTTQLAGKEPADATIIKEGELSSSYSSTSTTTGANSNAVKSAHDLTAKIADIKDNLTSTDTNKPLSANQGKELKTLVDAKVSMATVGGTAPVTMSQDDFILDGTEVDIRQNNITSQNYIASGNTLNQNISAIDQRLGFLTQNDSGEGTWTVLWNNEQLQARNASTGVIGDVATLVDIFKIDESGAHNVQTYYPIFRISLFKIPSIRELVFYYKGQVDAGSEGKVKLTCGTLSLEGSNVTSSGSFGNLKGMYLDISALANYQVYDIKVEMKINDADAGDQTFEIKEALLVGKYQITGNLVEQENPSA